MSDPLLTASIEKRFPSGQIISAAFSLPPDGPHVSVLFGPSGSGKTTILRCLAGLERLTRGSIRFRKELWADSAQGLSVTPQRRQVGYLHQDYSLFPHLNVEENVGYSLSGVSSDERKKRVIQVLNLLSIEDLQERRPSQLSGGQQQRVALARALVREPELLLLDEPFSALDRPTREQLQGELDSLIDRLGLHVVMVTHDWTEALTFGDQLLVLSEGRVLQAGTPQEVFSRPTQLAVAAAVGVECVVLGHVVEQTDELLCIQAGEARIWAVDPGHRHRPNRLYVCIRASDVTLEIGRARHSSARNHLPGVVNEVVPSGTLHRVTVDVGFPIVAFITGAALQELRVERGREVRAVVKASAIHLIPAH